MQQGTHVRMYIRVDSIVVHTTQTSMYVIVDNMHAYVCTYDTASTV